MHLLCLLVARAMYHAVDAATKAIMITYANGGISMSTLMPTNASAMIATTTAVDLKTCTRSNDQASSERTGPINFDDFIAFTLKGSHLALRRK